MSLVGTDSTFPSPKHLISTHYSDDLQNNLVIVWPRDHNIAE